MNSFPEVPKDLPELIDRRFMHLALCQARKGLGKTSPNPCVGTVISKDGVVLATGYHRRAGEPHAEIEALSGLSDRKSAEGATLYVTLEPCCTYGRTPPCTKAIIQAKLARVVIGAIDANPQHEGRGVDDLRQAGISVTTGVLETECTRLNVGFNKWITTGMPWVIAKVAQSLDGRLTRPPGESQWLANDRSLRLVHRLRATVDAILVGAETVRCDNPQLTVRGVHNAVQPRRVIVTQSGNIPPDARVLCDEFADRTIIYRERTWLDILKDLGKRNVTRLLVDGGGQVLGNLLDENQIDEIWCFIAPLLTGGNKPSFGGLGVKNIEDAIEVRSVRYKRIGNDVLVVGQLKRPAL